MFHRKTQRSRMSCIHPQPWNYLSVKQSRSAPTWINSCRSNRKNFLSLLKKTKAWTKNLKTKRYNKHFASLVRSSFHKRFYCFANQVLFSLSFCVAQYFLLNEVCCSLVNKTAAPGQNNWDAADSVWTKIKNLAKDISVHEPEFLLKVCLPWMTIYCRQITGTITNSMCICMSVDTDWGTSQNGNFCSYFMCSFIVDYQTLSISKWLSFHKNTVSVIFETEQTDKLYMHIFSLPLGCCLRSAGAEYPNHG